VKERERRGRERTEGKERKKERRRRERGGKARGDKMGENEEKEVMVEMVDLGEGGPHNERTMDDEDEDVQIEGIEVDDEDLEGVRVWGKGAKPSFERKTDIFSEQARLQLEENERFAIDPSRTKAKLELLSSNSIQVMLVIYYGSIVLSLLILIAWAITVNLVFREEAENFESFILLELDLIGAAMVAVVLFLFGLAYVFRVLLLRIRQRTIEMIFTAVMLVGLIIAFNPFILVAAALQNILTNEDVQIKTSALYSLVAAIAYEGATLFYMLAMTRLYGMWKNPKGFFQNLKFYVPIVLVVVVAFSVKLVTGLFFRFRYYYTPFGVLITLVMLAVNGYWDTALYACVIVTIGLEIGVYVLALYSTGRTWRRLAKVPYAPYRYKQLGFRFFVYHTITCWTVLMVYDILITATTPPDRYINSFLAWKSDRESNGQGDELLANDSADVLILGQSYAFFPVYLLITVWAVEIAYVNLPADSRGCRGWFLPVMCQRKRNDDDHIHLARAYTATEEISESLYEEKISEYFCLETCVEALNNAKLVYNNCQSAEEFNASVGHENSNVPVVKYIHIPETDTHCFIALGKDRIYVCFRGTKSVQNIKTDLKSTTTSCTRYFQHSTKMQATALDLSDLDAVEEGGKEAGGFLPATMAASPREEKGQEGSVPDSVGIRGRRVHAGFLKAYLSVRSSVFKEVKQYLSPGKPVIVVGHSLGGALATLFVYDLALRRDNPNLEGCRLVSYTYGSPRVGNTVFATHFNSLVPETWRCVNAQDIVTQIPLGRMGFQHVGTLVLIDRNGNLMVDPSVIERNWWHRQVASSGKYHMGGVYIENLTKCIELSHPNVEPQFWKRATTADDDVKEDQLKSKKHISVRTAASNVSHGVMKFVK